MKKFYILLLIFAVNSNILHSQSNLNSLGFNYAALVRDTLGKVIPNKTVKLKFTLLLGISGSSSNAPWIETQDITTDAFGFANATIGTGTKFGGTANSFSEVDFSATNYWLLIEILNTSTNAFETFAKQALQSVPYAKVAGSLSGSAAIPSGTIVAFAGDTSRIPTGWLLCDGRELDNSNVKYKPLFDAIKYNWGTSNNANKFNIPYTLGLFLRGVNLGGSNDADANARTPITTGASAGNNVGSFQADILKNHTHTVTSIGSRHGRYGVNPGTNFYASSGDVGYGGGQKMTTDNNPNLGSETRPKNVYVNYIIKL